MGYFDCADKNRTNGLVALGKRPWTAEEDTILWQMLAAGKMHREVAAALGRPLSSIASRLTWHQNHAATAAKVPAAKPDKEVLITRRAWTAAEDAELLDRRARGQSKAAVAKAMGRAQCSVISRLELLRDRGALADLADVPVATGYQPKAGSVADLTIALLTHEGPMLREDLTQRLLVSPRILLSALGSAIHAGLVCSREEARRYGTTTRLLWVPSRPPGEAVATVSNEAPAGGAYAHAALRTPGSISSRGSLSLRTLGAIASAETLALRRSLRPA